MRSSLQADDLLQEKIQAYNEITAQVLACSEQIEEERNEMFALHSRAASKKSEAGSMESYRSSLQKRKAQLLTEGEELEQNTRAYQADRQKDLTDQEAAAARLQEISADSKLADRNVPPCCRKFLKLQTAG